MRLKISTTTGLLPGAASRRRRTGLSLVEVLAATLISTILVGSVVSVFVLTIRASDDAEAVVRAANRARAATERISNDLRFLRVDPAFAFFDQTLVLQDAPLAYGDFVDQDGDSVPDEELVTGHDNDADAGDQHGVFPPFAERPRFVGVTDFGDRGVDEDFRFSHDRITMRLLPDVNYPNRRQVSYYIGTFEGEDNVLLREEIILDSSLGPIGTATVDPVVFDVVSLDILAWDPNRPSGSAPPPTPYWVSEWNAALIPVESRPYRAPVGTPPLLFPAAFLVRVTVSAESLPLTEVGNWPTGGRQLRTETIDTVVPVESVINDARYTLYVRD